MFSSKKSQNMLFGNFVYDHIIPKDHLLKKMAEAVDFSFVEQETRDLYSTIGRPGWSPITLFKCCLIAFLFDVSDRQLEDQINYHIVFKWFVGLDIDGRAPDHSTMTRFRDRLGEEGFRRLFNRIVEMAEEAGLVNERLTIIDSTDVAANVDIGRLKKHQQGDDDNSYVDRHSPDQDARFGRKSKKKGFYGYKDHIAVDADSMIITGVQTTPGNVPDRDVFSQLLENSQPETVTADKAYDAAPNWLYLEARSIKPAIIPHRRCRGRPPGSERQRSWIERKFSELKRCHGKDRCRWIGVIKAEIQSLITCSVVNLKTMTRLIALASSDSYV